VVKAEVSVVDVGGERIASSFDNSKFVGKNDKTTKIMNVNNVFFFIILDYRL